MTKSTDYAHLLNSIVPRMSFQWLPQHTGQVLPIPTPKPLIWGAMRIEGELQVTAFRFLFISDLPWLKSVKIKQIFLRLLSEAFFIFHLWYMFPSHYFYYLSNFNTKNYPKSQNALMYCFIYQNSLPICWNLILIKIVSQLNFKLNNWSWKNKGFFFHRGTDGCKLICKDTPLLTKKTQKIKDENMRFVSHIFLRRNSRLYCIPNFQRVLPQLVFFSKSCYFQRLAVHAFTSSSFLFFQVWDSCSLYGVNYTTLRFQHGREKIDQKRKKKDV